MNCRCYYCFHHFHSTYSSDAVPLLTCRSASLIRLRATVTATVTLPHRIIIIVGCRLLRLLCDLGDSTILNHFLFSFFLDGVLSKFIFCLLFILLLYLYIYIYLRFIDFSFWHYCHAILLSLSF